MRDPNIYRQTRPEQTSSFAIRVQVQLFDLNIPLCTRPLLDLPPELPPSIPIVREALERVADPRALGLHQRLDQPRLLEARIPANYQSPRPIKVKQRHEDIADESERVLPREQVQEVAAVDDRQLPQQLPVGEQRRGGPRRVERVGLDKGGPEAIAVAEEVVAEVPEEALDVRGVEVLRRGPVGGQAAQVLAEEGPKVDEALPGPDAVKDLRVDVQLGNTKVEESEHPDAGEGVLCPRFISLSPNHYH